MTQIRAYEYYMKADHRPAAEQKLVFVNLLGNWQNTNLETNYVTQLVFSERDKRLILRVYGANEPEPIDWGEIEAIPYVGGDGCVVTGFHALYPLNGNKINIWAYAALGALLLQIYVSYEDGSGRSNHFTREFFHRS